jgi:histidinol phosphatase-like enzyme (inositol monophosphatase family)
MTFPELEALAHRLADAAAAATLPLFRAGIAVEHKADSNKGAFDPVTEADRAAEQAIRLIIEQEHPGHGVIGEEFDAVPGTGRFEWVIDPIDGTRSYMAGVPLWTTIIGLRIDGVPALGLVDQPYDGDRFRGWGRRAQFRNRWGDTRDIHTRPCAELDRATLMTTSPALMAAPGQRACYDAVEQAVRLYRYGADGYAYCLLASGHIDLVVEAGLEPYDIVALVPIVEAAGGVITSWSGGSVNQGGTIVAAGDQRVHASALRMLRAGASDTVT